MDEPVGDRHVAVDRIVIAAPTSRTRDVASGNELADDPVRGTYRDADSVSDLTQADPRVLGDAQQNPGMVGQKRPRRGEGEGLVPPEY